MVLFSIPVPKGPLCVVILFLGSQDWLGECKEGESKIGEPILVLLHVGVALHQLVQLKPDEASDEGGGGGNGWDDPSGNSLAGQSISGLDAVVGSSGVTAI